MSQLGKWIDGLAPDNSVGDAAQLSLEARLSAVTYWLPLAATYADRDIEYVHRLRVSTRRAAAALELYRNLLPKRPARWLKKRLQKIRRAAGTARDLDVLAERLREQLGERGEALLADVAERREAAQPAIIAARDHACCEDRVRHKIATLLEGLASGGKTKRAKRQQPFRDWASRQLHATAEQFFAAMPADDSDLAALHQFRIQGKALRYAMELLAPAFGPEMRKDYYPLVEELQERLGRVNDHVSGSERLNGWCEATDDAERAGLLGECVEREREQLAEALDRFRTWWTPQRADALRRGLLGEPAADQHREDDVADQPVTAQT